MVIFFIYGCSSNENRILTYKQLPPDVRDKFEYVYNYKEAPKVNVKGDTIDWYSPPFAECYNLNKSCHCEIESNGGLIDNPYFSIKSCGKKIDISWKVLQRVFIIKNDSIYFPNSRNAATSTGESRSFDIKIDTLNFTAQKIR